MVGKLQGRGYLEAGVDTLVFDSDTAHVSLHLGQKYSVSRLTIENRENATNEVDLQFRRKKAFRYNQFEEQLNRSLNGYLENGYPFAKLEPQKIDIEDYRVSGLWRIVSNPLFTWDSIQVKGPVKLKQSFLQQYLGIQPGKRYQESRFQKASERIGRLSFVRELKPPEVEFAQNKATVYTYLERQSANRFDGILGLLSNSSKDGKLEVTGELNLFLVNSFRRGEKISFNWQKLEAQTQRLSTSLQYPYLFNSMMGVDVGFRLHKQDTTYLNTEANLGVMFLSVGGNYLKLNVDIKNSSLLSTRFLQSQTVLPDFADSKSVLYGVELRYQNIDYPLNPRKGWDLNASIGSGTKKIKRISQLPESVYEGMELNSLLVDGQLDASYYFPLYRRWGMKLRTAGGFLHNSNLFENDLYRLGGLKTIRGFDEELFRASAYVFLNGELRYLPNRNSAFYLFWDGGGIRKEVLDVKQEEYPWGVGMGMNFETGAGIFSLNYAVGKRKGVPLQIQSAKIHFGFVSRF